MDYMTECHAFKFQQMAIAQQQRILKQLAKNARVRQKKNLGNSESEEANRYDWHRNVRLKREARAVNLLRGYLKGLKRTDVEAKLKESTLPAYRLSFPVEFFNDVDYDKFFDWVWE